MHASSKRTAAQAAGAGPDDPGAGGSAEGQQNQDAVIGRDAGEFEEGLAAACDPIPAFRCVAPEQRRVCGPRRTMDVLYVRGRTGQVRAERGIYALIFQQFGATGERIVRERVE